MTSSETLIRRLVAGDPAAGASILDAAGRPDADPRVLAAAALVGDAEPHLTRARRLASSSADRHLLALVDAHRAGDHDRLDALARDHLADHPGDALAAWIAARPARPEPSGRRLTAALLVTAAVATNVAFTVLGSVFDYPDVLQHPTEQILASFRAHEGPVIAWFTVLALSAALFGPIAVLVGRLSSRRAMRIAVPVGIAAAVVQVIGLSRWPLLVPGLAAGATSSDPAVAAAARDHFTFFHHLLGQVVGETFGYLLTGLWTLLVIAALRWDRWFSALGAIAAGMILSGVLIPLGIPGTDFANFLGYVAWSVWLLAFAGLLVFRRGAR